MADRAALELPPETSTSPEPSSSSPCSYEYLQGLLKSCGPGAPTELLITMGKLSTNDSRE